MYLLGGGKTYVYQTDPGRQANQMNEEMLREILEARDSARNEIRESQRSEHGGGPILQGGAASAISDMQSVTSAKSQESSNEKEENAQAFR